MTDMGKKESRRFKEQCPSHASLEGTKFHNQVLRSHEFPIVHLYSSLRHYNGVCSDRSRSSLLLQEPPVGHI